MTFPKILIISHNALSMHTNNGKTLYSLFKDWPSENIAQFYFHNEAPESDKFSSFFRVTDIDIVKVLFGRRKKSNCGEIIEKKVSDSTSNHKKSTISVFLNLLLKNCPFIVTLLRNILYQTKLWNSALFSNWCKNFKPEGVFFLGGNYKFSFDIAVFLSNKYKIPLYIYITDDYILNNANSLILLNSQRNNLIKTYKKSFNIAKNVFVIGDMMASEFRLFFNRDFIPIMNIIEIDKYNIKTDNKKETNNITITYIGGLHLNRWKQIIEFGELIKRIEADSNYKIKVEIYSFEIPPKQIYQKLSKHPLYFCGSLFGEKVIEKLNNSDILLHVESEEKKYRQLTKLSVSTKISEYLASNKCIIGFGPSEVASMKFISDNNIGITITDNMTIDEKINTIKTVIVNKQLREEYGKRAFSFAQNTLDAVVVRKKFLTNFL
ncbi:MAG: hypothetical protein V1773_16525 [bacterium]